MNNERGITLVELLAAVTISTMILGAATTLFYSIQKKRNRTPCSSLPMNPK